MANELERIIKITVDTQNGIVKVNGLSAAIYDLDQIQKNLNNTWVASTKVNKEVVEEVKRGEIAIKEEIKALELQRGKIAETTIQYGQFTAKIQELEGELAKLRGTSVKASDGLTKAAAGAVKLKNSSGLASQTIVEVGRTISDANYGFTAVANNLSQLSYYFVTLTEESKGVGNAMKSLGSQLLSAGGVVIALQILITVFEKLSLKQREANREIEETAKTIKNLNKEVSNQLDRLDYLSRFAVGSTNAFAALKREFKEAGEYLDSLSEEEQANSSIVQEAVKQQVNLIEARRQQSVILAKLAGDQEYLNGKEKGSLFTRKELLQFDLVAAYEAETKALDALLPRKKKEAEERDFIKQNLLDFSKDILKFQRDAEEEAIDLEEDKLARQRKYAQESLFLEYQMFLEKEKIRHMNKLAETKDETERAQIKQNLQDTEMQALIEFQNAVDALNISFDKKGENLEINKARRIKNIIESGVIDRLNASAKLSRNALDAIDFEVQAEAKAHEQKMAQLKEIYDYRISKGYDVAEVNAQIANETARHEEANTELFIKAQDTKLAIANQVGQAIMEIAGEGSAVGKAVGVAMAIINTREAITSALGEKPYGPWNIAKAVAVGAFGFSQVQKIMQQKLPVEGKGSRVSASVQAPSFNIVGASSSSQLASAVQGQFEKPIKAYVLAKDVSTAQEMDRNIVGAASLG